MQNFLEFYDKDINERRTEALSGLSEHGKLSVCRTWCDPNNHVEIVGGDVGHGYVFLHSLRAGHDYEKFPVAAMESHVRALSPGTLFVIERAHMAIPQTPKSLAQPWTADELQGIYAACRDSQVTLRLFPHQHTSKARQWVAIHCPPGFVDSEKTTDMNDARALAYWVANNNGQALAVPLASFAPHSARTYGMLVARASNIVLNAARARGYEGQVFPYVASVAQSLLIITTTGVTYINNESSAFSVAALVCGELYGEPVRFVYKGKTPGFRFWIKNVLKFSPCHQQGSVARSNLAFHRFRAFLAEYGRSVDVIMKTGAKVVPFSQHTPQQDAVRRSAWREARKQVRSAYHAAVLHSQDFRPYEILEFQERPYGR